MFSKTIRTILLSLVVSIGGIAATSTTANAGRVHVDFSIGGPGFYFSSGHGHRRHVRRGYRHDYGIRRHRGHYGHRFYDGRHSYRSRRCTPRRAFRKARRMGVRDGRIARVNRRAIVVKGYRYGERTRIKFGRGRHCPVLVVRSH